MVKYKMQQSVLDSARFIQLATNVGQLTAYLVDPNAFIKKQARLKYQQLTGMPPNITVLEESNHWDIDEFERLLNSVDTI